MCMTVSLNQPCFAGKCPRAGAKVCCTCKTFLTSFLKDWEMLGTVTCCGQRPPGRGCLAGAASRLANCSRGAKYSQRAGAEADTGNREGILICSFIAYHLKITPKTDDISILYLQNWRWATKHHFTPLANTSRGVLPSCQATPLTWHRHMAAATPPTDPAPAPAPPARPYARQISCFCAKIKHYLLPRGTFQDLKPQRTKLPTP